MAQHSVTIDVPSLPISNKDIIFLVKQDGGLFGRLKISKGSIVWLPGNKQNGHKLTWKKLSVLASEHGTPGSYPI